VRIGNEVRTGANVQYRTGTTLDRAPLFPYSVFSVRDGRTGKAKSLKRIVAAAAKDGRKSRGSAGVVGNKAWMFFYWFLASYILWYCSTRKFFCCSSSVCWFRRRNSGKRRGETVWRPDFFHLLILVRKKRWAAFVFRTLEMFVFCFGSLEMLL
jgi:hypothetical protein